MTLKALSESKHNKYSYSRPDSALLESFLAPDMSELSTMSIHIEVPEFTSLCPITGQPDFAKIVIDYLPIARCVESKSLKLYMMSYRNHGDFHEACVARMHSDLMELLQPAFLRVEGQFTPRGGIPFWPVIEYSE